MSAADAADVLIVGGYGTVGRHIATRLARSHPGRVIVAGRRADAARAAAAEIGHGARGRRFDVSVEPRDAELAALALAIVCVDQHDTRFVARCLSSGISYIDVSARYAFLSQVEELDDEARASGAAALLSVGVAPGLTNLLAAEVHRRMDSVRRIDIFLELGLGDHHGRAAVEWLCDNLDTKFSVPFEGSRRTVTSFTESRFIALPGRRPRAAYRVDLSDQHTLRRTLATDDVSTYLCLSSPVATWLLAQASRYGVTRALRHRALREAMVWLGTHLHVGTDRCAVVARATGKGANGATEVTAGIEGRNEALMTAIVATESARRVLDGDIARGVHHADQVLSLERVIDAMRTEVSPMTTWFA